MRRALLLWTLLLLPATGPAFAQDGAAEPQPPAVPPPAAGDTAQAEAEQAETGTKAAEPLTFGDSLAAATAAATEDGKPLLVVCIPDWYESPAWKRLEDDVLSGGEDTAPLRAFVRVLVKETRDHEVHVRHRVEFEGYPLAVVLAPGGAYLGRVSGIPGGGEGAGWVDRVAAIPGRARRIAELRTRLAAAPEDAGILFELGKALSDAGEYARAEAVFERMELADPLVPAVRLGEARYLRLRRAVVDLLAAKKFGDVEGPCLKWLRRFSEHERAPAVVLLQANARFLAGRKDDARALWQRLVDDHAGTAAAKSAAKVLADLAD